MLIFSVKFQKGAIFISLAHRTHFQRIPVNKSLIENAGVKDVSCHQTVDR